MRWPETLLMSRAMPGSLLQFRADVHSQNGEDGVLAEIFRRLGIERGWCVEFGAWDGMHLSNTFALVQQGWRAVYLEGDPAKVEDLKRTAGEWPDQITAIEAFVEPSGPSSLDALLAPTGLAPDFDLLSIDVDGTDWHIWKGATNYCPKVVVIEVNSSYAPPSLAVHGDGVDGSSFMATVELGREKGYTAVAHTGNVILVRDDLVDRLGLPAEELTQPEQLFLTDWVKSPGLLAGAAARIRQRIGRTA
jgi:hypothetical protein